MKPADVERAMLADWAVRGTDAPSWPDPHPDLASPRDEEYERVTDWSKYRIIGLRVHSWTQALVRLDLATTAPAGPRPDVLVPQTAFVLQPVKADAVPVTVYLSQVDGVPDSGVDIGGTWLPNCGCDACDSGSDQLLGQIDDLFDKVLAGKVTGDRRSWLG